MDRYLIAGRIRVGLETVPDAVYTVASAFQIIQGKNIVDWIKYQRVFYGKGRYILAVDLRKP